MYIKILILIIICAIDIILYVKLNKQYIENFQTKKTLNFIHITKNAGTTIEDLAKEKGILWGRFNDEYCKNINTTRNISDPWHNYFPSLDKSVRSKYNWFLVVRNPYDRILSEFKYHVKMNGNKNFTNKTFNEFIQNKIKEANNTNTNVGKYGGHFAPQYKYLTNDDKIHILKFENLNQEFNDLMKQYNINLKLDEKHNVSNHKFTINDFNESTKKLIQEVYKKDFDLFNYEIKNTIESFTNEKKNIFIFWNTGFENAPLIVKKCLESWKKYNKEWNIIELDNTNLDKWIDTSILSNNIDITAKSDIIRILLLTSYGGLWVDATLYCTKPLSKWLNKYITNGFWAFSNPGEDRLISSWFIYGNENNSILIKWKDKVLKYWENRNKKHTYYWFHYLFNELYNENTFAKNTWDSTKHIEAVNSHIFVPYNSTLNYPLTYKIKDDIDKNKTPVYKLTYKIKQDNIYENSNLQYLFENL